MKKFISQSPGRVFTQPSKTVPDQALTIKQILDRHTRGLPVRVNRNAPVFTGDEFADQFKNMDIEEQAQILEAGKTARETVKNARETAKKEKEILDRKNYEEKLRKEMEEKYKKPDTEN